MSTGASSSVLKRPRKKPASPTGSAPSAAVTPPPQPRSLPLVPCPCCRVRTTIRLVSRSEANPGRVFYKCPNHRGATNPCNHYYWEDGEDSYADYLATLGYNFSVPGRTVDSAGEIATEATEEEEPGLQNHRTEVNAVLLKMDACLKKMDVMIKLSRDLLAAAVVLIAILLYVAISK